MSIKLLDNYNDLAFQNAYRNYYDDMGIIDFKHWDRLFVDMEKEDNLNTYLLFENNVIIGFIQIQNIQFTHWFFKEQCGFIREFWILKQLRNQGYGSRLFDYIMKRFKEENIKKVILTTEKVQSFYTNRGFVVDSSYTALNNDIVMTNRVD